MNPRPNPRRSAPPTRRRFFKLPGIPRIQVPLWTGWIVLAFGLAILGIEIIGIGLDARADVSVWLGEKTNVKPLNSAIARAQMISDDSAAVASDHPNWSNYRKTIHAMVITYDRIDHQPPSKVVNPVPDSAPLEMMLIESWTHSAGGGDNAITKAVSQHVLAFNTFCEAISALLIFAMVWIWMSPATRFGSAESAENNVLAIEPPCCCCVALAG